MSTGSGELQDAFQGLPMLALAEFRSDPDRGLIVRWTSLGSPGLAGDVRSRTLFAEFLVRLAEGSATLAHWDAFIVEHYPDILVEDIRRACVRMFLHRTALGPLGEAERVQLHAWATALGRPHN
jgi:hypothetical protein